MKNTPITRRQFTRGMLAAGALTTAPAFLRGKNLNDKLNVAIIGSGGRGGTSIDEISKLGQNLVAFCDVDTKNLNAAAAKFPGAKKYTDFRKMFDKGGDFDAVAISTTEHTHAFATMLAIQNGKHIYCEKPLTHDIWEARRIREAAAKTKLATQMGIQGHSSNNHRRVIEVLQSGAIGKIHEVHVWTSRAWGWQSEEAAKAKDIVYTPERPKDVVPVPDTIDWDLWLGPAPERPYHSVYFPGPKWYRWWDFGNGTMSDLGSHLNDLPFWALKLRAPLTVEASGPPPHPEIAPASMSVTYEYGARGDVPPVKLTWHQGDNKPEIWKNGTIPQWTAGCLFIGDKGMLLSDYNKKHMLLPEKDFAGFQAPPETIPNSPGHWAEWVTACKTGSPTMASFEYGGWLTEANHLGNVAYRTGKKLEWDAENIRAKNAPEADKYIRREYRKGWVL